MIKFAGARTRLLMGAAFAALTASAVAPAAMAQTAAAAPDTSTGISEVIVTATKTSTNLQKTPISISVIGGADMESRHVESLVNLMDGAVPSLRVATFEARQSALTIGIRGIVPFDANQTARDQGVGVYIDGVYLGRQQGLNAALFDVERIEVLRGPQGTLYGRNTVGGAIKYVTKRIDDVAHLSARATYGSYDQADGVISASTPVGNGTLRFGGSLARLSRGGFGKNPTSRSPTGPTPSSPPRSTPRRPTS